MGNLTENYGPTETERLHRKSMLLGSERLLMALRKHHPRIVSLLTAKHNKEQAS